MNPLEKYLRASKPRLQPPPDLHQAIMTAVRTRSHEPQPRDRFTLARVTGGLTLAIALGLVGFALWRPPPQPTRPSAESQATLVTSASGETAWTLPNRMPEMMLSPLTSEMEAMRRDIWGAWEHLLATLP